MDAQRENANSNVPIQTRCGTCILTFFLPFLEVVFFVLLVPLYNKHLVIPFSCRQAYWFDWPGTPACIHGEMSVPSPWASSLVVLMGAKSLTTSSITCWDGKRHRKLSLYNYYDNIMIVISRFEHNWTFSDNLQMFWFHINMKNAAVPTTSFLHVNIWNLSRL